jgi:hypothetical protein
VGSSTSNLSDFIAMRQDPTSVEPPVSNRLARLGLVSLLAILLCGVSWWVIALIAGPDVFLPSAWAGASGAPRLEDPPYIGLEPSYNDGQQRPLNSANSLWIEHQTRKIDDRRGELRLRIENRSPVMGNVVVYLVRRAMKIDPGQQVSLTATATLVATDKQAEVGLGFHAYADQGPYVGQLGSPQATLVNGVEGAQALEMSYARPRAGDTNGGRQDIGMLSPRLAIYNIAPGAKLDLKVDWRSAGTDALRTDQAPTVTPWPAPLSAVPGRIWRFDALGLGSGALEGELTASIELRQGAKVAFKADRTTRAWGRTGTVRDPWRVPLPESVPPGTYEARLELRQGARSVVSQSLGTLQVAPHSGMWIGQTFHRYPGSAETKIGPLALSHQFVRSFANGAWDPNVWWPGVDRYHWKDIDKWARFHAPKGERRLLIVFSGSPTWASAAPDQPSSMKLPGYAAPPRKSLYPAYGRMVSATIERLKGRVMGVECWNEPDLAEFFTGSSTELADLCQLVHDNTKAVDPSIPVICPQTTSARALSLVMSARATDGRALHEMCDMIGNHVYGAMGDDAQGAAYDAFAVADVVRDIQSLMARHGVQKPVAITEYGLSSCGTRPTNAHPVPFVHMSNEAAGEALYQSLATLQASGVGLVALYSYDEGNTDPNCRPGGSRGRMLDLDAEGQQRPNRPVIERFNQAVRDFGAR